MSARVVVFIDYQNVYRIGRALFHPISSPPQAGQIDPVRLSRTIVFKGAFDRELIQVRVYRGRPTSSKDPKGYGANVRQCRAWESNPLAKVITRTLRYPSTWPSQREEEKGIDVALAIDFVMMAVKRRYDVGILVSTDTDLKPALEAVCDLRGRPFPRCEVAAYSSPLSYSRRLSVKGRGVWCHWLSEMDYRAAADPTNYLQ
jgi:uncharacterized LabA/DUF88 family protein